MIAGWSGPVARQPHKLEVVGSNPTSATNLAPGSGAHAPESMTTWGAFANRGGGHVSVKPHETPFWRPPVVRQCTIGPSAYCFM